MTHEETNQGVGHRARLLSRFTRSGLSALHDYEILELLLSCVISRKDVKPIALDLLKNYKTISAVLSASTQQLEKFDGIGPRAAALICFMRETMAYCLAEKVANQSVITHRSDVDAYLKFHLGNRGDEFVAGLFLDNGHRVRKLSILAEGTVNQCVVFPRVVFEEAITFKASSIILAHNHPGGSQEPSAADWNITTKLVELGKLIDLKLMDHLIITKDATISLRDFPQWPA